MSSPNLPVEFSPEARADYTSILFYSSEQWGEQQQDVYNAALEQALARIGKNPSIGRVREELIGGVRGHRVRQHVILYRVHPDRVRVLRILHVRMDTAGQLAE